MLFSSINSLVPSQGSFCSRFKLTAFLVSLTLLLTGAISPTPLYGEQSPNIVVVLVDDMGWSDLSCFGGTEVETKNIDRLAHEGIRFTQFYANSPLCSPSRVALLTGQFPQRLLITSFINDRAANARRGMRDWLDPETPTLASRLKSQGYVTGHFGKWHMGGGRDVGDAPLISEYGFDRSFTNFEGLGPRVLPLLDAYDSKPARRHTLGSHNLGQGPIEWAERSQVTQIFVDHAVKFIDDAQAAGRPFFINLWPDDVHSPFFPPADMRGDESKRQLYLGVLKTMDRQLGVLFDRIHNDPQLHENTIIVLMSDNGPEPDAGTSGQLRGVKGQLYEGGIRSPLIVWSPKLVHAKQAGSTNSTAVVSSVDLNASLLKLALGTKLDNQPSEADGKIDGQELVDTFLGVQTTGRTRPLFWQRPPDRPGPADARLPDLAVRDQQWKLLLNLQGKKLQLYDLEKDPHETVNLAQQHPDIAERLKAMALAWHASLPQLTPVVHAAP